jgi:DNA-directed RNA polymerase subunit L
MAKKKKDKSKEEDDDLDEFEGLEDEDIEIAIPLTKKKPEAEQPLPSEDIVSDDISETEEEMEEFVFELEEEEKPTYKFVGLTLKKGNNVNDYELMVSGQSHGFCNIFVKYLLNIEGVNIAAYKATGLEPPKIFLRLDNGYKIKEILNNGIEALREDVIDVQKLFQILM